MLKFFNAHDKDFYQHQVQIYKEVENCNHLKVYDWIEVGEFEDIKFFHFPTSTAWTRFYGDWTELRNKLKEDFPKKFPNIKFYCEAPVPGLII